MWTKARQARTMAINWKLLLRLSIRRFSASFENYFYSVYSILGWFEYLCSANVRNAHDYFIGYFGRIPFNANRNAVKSYTLVFSSRNDEYKDKPNEKNIKLFAHMHLNWFCWTLDIHILFSSCLILAKQIANRIEWKFNASKMHVTNNVSMYEKYAYSL